MAAIAITNYSDEKIRVYDTDSDTELLINKAGASYSTSGDYLVIRYYDYANSKDRKMVKIDYNDITSHTVASADELMEAVKVVGASALKATGQHIRIWDFLMMG